MPFKVDPPDISPESELNQKDTIASRLHEEIKESSPTRDIYLKLSQKTAPFDKIFDKLGPKEMASYDALFYELFELANTLQYFPENIIKPSHKRQTKPLLERSIPEILNYLDKRIEKLNLPKNVIDNIESIRKNFGILENAVKQKNSIRTKASSLLSKSADLAYQIIPSEKMRKQLTIGITLCSLMLSPLKAEPPKAIDNIKKDMKSSVLTGDLATVGRRYEQLINSPKADFEYAAQLFETANEFLRLVRNYYQSGQTIVKNNKEILLENIEKDVEKTLYKTLSNDTYQKASHLIEQLTPHSFGLEKKSFFFV